jgi:hypothetical protein
VLTQLLDALLGHHCALGCGQRVFPKDLERHLALDHAGDERLTGYPGSPR